MTKQLFFIGISYLFAFLVIPCILFSQNRVNSIADLVSVKDTNSLVYVAEAKRGGLFYYRGLVESEDGGTVFKSKFEGYWIRVDRESNEASPLWWGAIGDGINDDIQAIENATDYCLRNNKVLKFSSGIFRISRQWIIGGKPVHERDIFSRQLATAPSWNIRQYEKSRFSNPIKIVGSSQTFIYGDFDNSTIEAILYFGVISNGNSNRPSPQFYTSEISDIGFYGRGSFNKGKFNQTALSSLSNQQIGLLIYRSQSIRISGCKFYGLKFGIVAQDVYFSEIINTTFSTCLLGFQGIGFNANKLDNVLADNCKVGMKILGSVVVCQLLNFEFCETGMEFSGEGLVINGMYCENDNLKKPNKFQIIFNNASGVQVNSANLTSGNRDIIFLDEKTKDVTITSSALYGPIKTSHPDNILTIKSTKGNYRKSGPGKTGGFSN